MTVDRALRILGRGYTREEARRLVVVCGLLLDAAESAFGARPAGCFDGLPSGGFGAGRSGSVERLRSIPLNSPCEP